MYQPHTCWDADYWDGILSAEGVCAGCDEASSFPCEFCGYGEVFSTHNPLAHLENDDAMAPPEDEWDEHLINGPYSWEKVAFWQATKEAARG